jgi:hypothetical protein
MNSNKKIWKAIRKRLEAGMAKRGGKSTDPIHIGKRKFLGQRRRA